jgi:hypothetical protein
VYCSWLLLIAVGYTLFISLITSTVHMLLLLVLSGLLFMLLRLKSGGGDRAELSWLKVCMLVELFLVG